MKTMSIIFLLVCGLLFFGLGCMADAVEGVGAIALFPGIIGLLEKIWPEVMVETPSA